MTIDIGDPNKKLLSAPRFEISNKFLKELIDLKNLLQF